MSRTAGLALAVAVVAFAAVTTAVGAASGAPPEFLLADLVTGMTFVVAGLTAVWLRPTSPAGPLLLLSGGLWYVGSYAPSMRPVVTYLGFAFEGYYDLALAALLLMLSSSDQRLRPRLLIVALGVAMAVRSAGRLFLQDPAMYGCSDCPPNPFAVWPSPPAFEAVEIVTNVAIGVLAVAVALVALRRLERAGSVWRRVRWPILAAGGIAMGAAAFDAFEYAWTTATGAPIVEFGEPWGSILPWAVFVARTLVPVAFLVATLRLRGAPGPLGPFAAGLDPSGGAGTIGDSLRAVFGDPTLRLLRPTAPGGWTAEDGLDAGLPGPGQGRSVTLVGSTDRPLAAIVHDPGLLDQQELVDGVVRVLRLALENERLEAQSRDRLDEVTASRERIVTAAQDERRRLERDLHDGAQQRLVGVMLALQQARSTADAAPVPDALREQLDIAAGETTEAMRELRELARGIHPAILEEEGLGPAVAALARRAAVPVDVGVELDGRLPRLVESTAYFTIAEALTNAQRHAGASHAAVRLVQAVGMLELEVSDDGRGGADPEGGTGLRGLADRVMALGGWLEVDSAVGQGTRIRASIPT